MDHAEVEEGEVVVGFAVAAGLDSAFRFEPGVGAFDGPAVAAQRVTGLVVSSPAAPDLGCRLIAGDRLPRAPSFADPRLDLPLAKGLVECFGVVAAVSPYFLGSDLPVGERVDQG